MKKISWQYIAGFFDGEGHISIVKHKGKKKYPYHQLRLCVTNTNKKVIETLKNKLGGAFIRVLDDKRGKRRKAFYLEIYQNNAIENLLRNIRRYSIVKRQQIDIGLAFIKHKKKKRHTKELDKKTVAIRQRMMEELKRLKRV